MCKWQFELRQQYSTTHPLIDITENIRKAFNTAYHQIVSTKLNHYGIRRFSNDWFKSYQSNRNRYIYEHGYESGHAVINSGLPQGSIAGPLILLLYKTNLNQAIKFSKAHHLADDASLLCLSNSIQKLNKLINADLKHLVNWLNINKSSLNWKLTETKIFKSKEKKFGIDLKMKLCGKRLYPTENVKYQRVKIDANFSWQCHINDLSIKLGRVNSRLSKMRKYVDLKISRSIYFSIFYSYLFYYCLVWAQNCSTIQRIVILQKNSC